MSVVFHDLRKHRNGGGPRECINLVEINKAIISVEKINTTLSADTLSGPFKVKGDIFWNNQKVEADIQTGKIDKTANTVSVQAELKLPDSDASVNFAGVAGIAGGIDLQGEVSSQNELLKNGPDVEYATAAFGQGIEITPIQLAKGFCIFANGGKLVKPYVVGKIAQGKNEINTKSAQGDLVVSPDVASKVTIMMISVVEKGFGNQARIPGYYIAGKTGTAEVPKINGKGYEDNNTIQSFIGFAPAFNPKFLILIKLDNPKVPKSSLSVIRREANR